MKKMLALLLIILFALSLSACDFEAFFYQPAGTVNGFEVATCRASREAFVSDYNCTEYEENMEITVPDEYQGFRITELGGATGSGYPCPFRISFELYMNAPAGSEFDCVFWDNDGLESWEFDVEYHVEYPCFRLNIGKYIKRVDSLDMEVYFPHINDDGSVTFYHPVVYIICSEENEHFYSRDGKLYEKETNKLIDDFEYATPQNEL